MSDGEADDLLRVQSGRVLFALRLLTAYNFLLVVFFAAFGSPVATLPTFFAGVASFTGAIAVFAERAVSA